jgi:hypothetical protein
MQVMRDAGCVFDVSADLLLTFSNAQTCERNIVRDMMQTTNSSVLRKFCDVCRYLNMEQLHEQALPEVVVFMCKGKHCRETALSYLQACGCEELLEHLSVDDIHQQNICDQTLSSMADWLALFFSSNCGSMTPAAQRL